MNYINTSSIFKSIYDNTKQFTSKLGPLNIGLIAISTLSIGIISQKSVRDKISSTFKRIKNKSSNYIKKNKTVKNRKPEWSKALRNGNANIESVLLEMSNVYEPDELLQELKSSLRHMETTAKVNREFKRRNDAVNAFNILRNNSKSKNLSERNIIQLADSVLLTNNPLRKQKTKEEHQAQKVSYYSSFFTKMITFIPSSFINLVEHVQSYPSQLVAIVFSAIAPYTLSRVFHEAKPLLGKVFGDIDTLLFKHSGKITIALVSLCIGLFYIMKKINLPSVTDYSDEIRDGKVPFRGLNTEESFKEIIEKVKLCLKKEKNQESSSIFLKAPDGSHPPIKQTMQMLAEMTLTQKEGFNKKIKFKRVSINSILVKANGSAKDLKSIWDRIVQEYGQDESTFIHLDGLQTKLYPLNDDEKKKSDIIALEGMIREDIKDGKIRCVISGDKEMENVLLKDTDFQEKFTTCATPVLKDVRRYIEDVYNPEDEWDSIFLPQSTVDFLTSAPKALQQEDRLPSTLEKALKSALNQVETKRNSLLMKNQTMRKKYESLRDVEGQKLENLKALKKELWQKFSAAKMVNSTESKQIQEAAIDLILVKYVLTPLYAQKFRNRQKAINQELKKEINEGPNQIPFTLEREEAVNYFQNYYNAKLDALPQDLFRIQEYFCEHLNKAVPSRHEAIDTMYALNENYFSRGPQDSCGPAYTVVMGGPAGNGKSEFARLIAAEVHHLLRGTAKDGIIEDHGEMQRDEAYAKDITHLKQANPTPNFKSYDLTLNPWNSGSNENKVVEDIKKDLADNRKRIICLDEWDKAPVDKMHIFLGLLDDRYLEYVPTIRGSKKDDKIEDPLAKQPTSRSDAGFFILTNLASKELSDPEVMKKSYAEQQKILENAFIEKYGKPAASRVSAFIPFPSLKDDEVKPYIEMYLKAVQLEFKTKHHININYEGVVNHFVQIATDQKGGKNSLREIKKVIEENVRIPLLKECYHHVNEDEYRDFSLKVSEEKITYESARVNEEDMDAIRNAYALDSFIFNEER